MTNSLKALLFMLGLLLVLGWLGDITGKGWLTNLAMILGFGVIVALINTGDQAAKAKGQSPLFFQ